MCVRQIPFIYCKIQQVQLVFLKMPLPSHLPFLVHVLHIPFLIIRYATKLSPTQSFPSLFFNQWSPSFLLLLFSSMYVLSSLLMMSTPSCRPCHPSLIFSFRHPFLFPISVIASIKSCAKVKYSEAS